MTRSAFSGSVAYIVESAFAENLSTATTRLLPVTAVDVSNLTHTKVPVDILRQRQSEGIAPVRTTYGGTFSFDMLLTGHGGTAAGALTATDLATLLSKVIGEINTAGVGTTASGGGTTTSTPIAGGNFAAGMLCRIGARGDGRGNGQFYHMSSTAPIVSTNALQAAANAADVVYAAQLVYPSETPGQFELCQSLRFQVQTANGQWILRGCYPTSIEFTDIMTAQIPKVRLTFAVSHWDEVNATFPSATATNAKAGAAVSAGSLFFNTVGTATRNLLQLRDISIAINFNVVGQVGPGGNFEHQTVVACKREACQATVTLTTDAETAGTSTYADIYDTSEVTVANRNILYTMSDTDGRAVGFHFPNCSMGDPRPTQVNVNGINCVRHTWLARTNTVTTNDLTLAAWKLAMG